MKYKFKNAEIEKALRLVANEFGIDNASFDKQIEEWGFADMIYMYDGARDVLCFSTELIEKVEEFNPDGWNSSKVEPPSNTFSKETSSFMLVEDCEGIPHKALFYFTKNTWRDAKSLDEISCRRYRIYPYD